MQINFRFICKPEDEKIDKNNIIKTIEKGIFKTHIVKRSCFKRIVWEIAKETGFDLWYKGEKNIKYKHNAYQSFILFDFFQIDFIENNHHYEFRGSMPNNIQRIYELMGSYENSQAFHKSFLAFLDKITTTFEIDWSIYKTPLSKLETIFQLYDRLSSVSDKVYYNISKNEYLLLDCSSIISFERLQFEDRIDGWRDKAKISEKSGHFNIKTDLKGEELSDELNNNGFLGELEHRKNNPTRSTKISKNKVKKYIPYDIEKQFKTSNQAFQKLKEALPGDILVNMFTSAKSELVVDLGISELKLCYYKCEAGFYSVKDRIVYFGETKNELITKILDLFKSNLF